MRRRVGSDKARSDFKVEVMFVLRLIGLLLPAVLINTGLQPGDSGR
jgi:hypothetical protein